MMKKQIYLSLIMTTLLSLPLQGQVKYEREYRVKAEAVPKMALSFIDSCYFSKKVKWLAEESLTGHSVEAKVKWQGVKYSIEFDTLGQIEDVELDIKWNTVPIETQNKINQCMADTFARHKIKRVQLQWTGNRSDLISLVRGQNPQAAYVTKYEIELVGRKDNEQHWYECLFSADGMLEQKRRIVFRNTDNLDF